MIVELSWNFNFSEVRQCVVRIEAAVFTRLTKVTWRTAIASEKVALLPALPLHYCKPWHATGLTPLPNGSGYIQQHTLITRLYAFWVFLL